MSHPSWQPNQHQHLARRAFGSFPWLGGLSGIGSFGMNSETSQPKEASEGNPYPKSYRNKGTLEGFITSEEEDKVEVDNKSPKVQGDKHSDQGSDSSGACAEESSKEAGKQSKKNVTSGGTGNGANGYG
ncbi:uncharacterized protein MELLADRAFT_113634 [Melampsora larici-populina 98AG31]|uniref:Uncharacterized protein n=1 Tax=Melampsora larici-populina (strain 98AG31 / pathotype 3-4-7) TaxID=747676 RepID=F4SAJ7_MELLP|nr:uncharacterized protein MELLADRAFT_113634 [Melampsora larici-populina 98AG31]EGF98343.1 hypothetical protein MELLADRAFT_113634 [Melampsora larici-populina 98AG31]